MSGDDGLKLDSKGELSVRRDSKSKDTKSELDQLHCKQNYLREKHLSEIVLDRHKLVRGGYTR